LLGDVVPAPVDGHADGAGRHDGVAAK